MSDKVKCIIRRKIYQGKYGIKETREDGDRGYRYGITRYSYSIERKDFEYLKTEDICNVEIERNLLDTYKVGDTIYIPNTDEIVTIKGITCDIFKQEYVICVNGKEIMSNDKEFKIYENMKDYITSRIRELKNYVETTERQDETIKELTNELAEIKNKYDKLVEKVKDHNDKNISDRFIWGSKIEI